MGVQMIKDNMSDFEIRVLGSNQQLPPRQNPPSPKWKWLAIALLAAILVVSGLVLLSQSSDDAESGSDNTQMELVTDSLSTQSVIDEKIPGPAFVEKKDTVVNDIPLRIYLPEGGRLQLSMGKNPEHDSSVFFAVQAADLRRDNHKPTGAFIYEGELISKGHSKYGFCAIIGDEISIGRQIETSLLERAIEQNGSFFRQYSLVTNGNLMVIPPKGKAIRRALCLRDGKFMVVESGTSESYHDFSQALVDIQVSEALALVGGSAYLMVRETDGTLHNEGNNLNLLNQFDNFLVWRK